MNLTPQRPLYVYRLSVSHWPTEDGKPWDSHYYCDEDGPEWINRLAEEPMDSLVAERGVYEAGDFLDPLGFNTPCGHRRRYLSASSANHAAAAMRAFGAVVHVERSEAVVWGDA